MSRDTVVWRPTPQPPPPTDHLPDQVARLLIDWLTDNGWSGDSSKRGEDDPYRLEYSQRTVGFLEGLISMRVVGAQELLAALHKHRQIDLWWSE